MEEEQVKIDEEPSQTQVEEAPKWKSNIFTVNLEEFKDRKLNIKIEKTENSLAAYQLLLAHKETGLIKNYLIDHIQVVVNNTVIVDRNIYCYNFTELSCNEIRDNDFTIHVKLRDVVTPENFNLMVNLVYENKK